jgi:acetyl esterase/lipase
LNRIVHFFFSFGLVFIIFIIMSRRSIMAHSSLSEKAQLIKERMAANREKTLDYFLSVPLDIKRADWEQGALNDVLPEHITIESVILGGIQGERITGSGFREDKVILYFHGGGLTSGSPITHRKLGAYIAAGCKIPVVIHDYPLAPEHPFPAALNASIAVYQSLLASGYKGQDIIFGGDSSGCGLACAVMLRLKQQGVEQGSGAALPGAAFFLSPMLDYTLSGDSLKTLAELDNQVFEEDLRGDIVSYCAGESPANPLISPLNGDMSGFPRVYIQAGSDEILLSDATRLADKLKTSGVFAELSVWKGMWHVFQFEVGNIPEADEALGEVLGFLNR